ncbi:flagellar basal body L-ring protein FlgH [Anaeromyxobacter diazotrophicus]|uniref:Flagellar L-ring protein n=1 Tax=Anaeromyxobacter diazotrophicus TaxID=2590199 RepID=A0A7I9VS93_9BACT|nr:flagellar basal body L-ring protein FlgH [Anaeromyxobacter diazotrophicus]GEJ59181.1 flagellar L-ring protein [Anaeromyxobacter diazotrophicus]
MRRQLPAAALLAALAGCATSTHIEKYVPKHREYEPASASQRGDEAPSPGSLWRDGRSPAMLYTDARALRENDLVVVKVEEVADAKRSADTDVTHNSSATATAQFLSSLSDLTKGPQGGLKGGLDRRFQGTGSTGRTERLTATVPALVRKVLPNGNLFIEGHRVVLVNSEEQHFYISGVVRPIDIDQENSVKSSMIAEAEVEFTGRGILSDNQQQGWVAKHLGWLWPF